MRVGFVTPRYGLEVNGGAEQHCRVLAERMAAWSDVEVVTTCALDYVTWRDEYPPGPGRVNGVPVLRFPVDAPRDPVAFGRLSAGLLGRGGSPAEELAWMCAQGPCSAPLLAHLESAAARYDWLVYVTYLYATTCFGLPLTASRSVLVPTAHDEPPLRLGIFREVFHRPRALVFNTPEEQALVNARFATDARPQAVIGVGLDPLVGGDPERFRREHAARLEGRPFVLYVGRIDVNKGCAQLFEYFARLRRERPGPPLALVLLGRAAMDVPVSPDIVPLGFVDGRTRDDAMAAAAAILVPSPYESLSLAALEAWRLGRPVLANGQCEVLRGQCRRSQAGLWYDSYAEFREALALLLERPVLAGALGDNGRRFVAAEYAWPVIDAKYAELFARLGRERAR